MAIEYVYKYMAGLDLELQPIGNFVSFIEHLKSRRVGFAVLQKTTGLEIGEEAIAKELRYPKPVIGYGGERTFPFISDPDGKIPGALAVLQKELVYSSLAIPLHKMRDAYTWTFTPVHYYIEANFVKVVREFCQEGYKLSVSDDLIVYERARRFHIKGPISLENIIGRK